MKPNLLSGIRPTGQLHLGHYFGVLKKWVKLQNSEKYNCFFMLADWHALTTSYINPFEIKKTIIDIVRDFVASGINPEKSTIFIQSQIPEIAEMHLLLSMITPLNWIERDPALKDLIRALGEGKEKKDVTYGMLGYPVLQTADILTFRAKGVPVGKDQEAHLELCREIARRFNHILNSDFFSLPSPLFSEFPRIKGIDGTKMGKSFKNDIKLSASDEETKQAVKRMITDRERIKKTDVGSVARCEVPFPYYQVLANEALLTQVKVECETAKRSCFDCKSQLADILNDKLKSIRENRENISEVEILQILKHGAEKARQEAVKTIAQVKKLFGLFVVN